jgi:recombination protein RecR
MSEAAHLDRLIRCLCRLPGVGRRSAERMALKLARDPKGLLAETADALREVSEKVCCCARCGVITTVERNPCRLCTDPRRDDALLCVVEDAEDILAIEKSSSFRGRYHSLMGKLSPMRGQGHNELRIDALLKRIDEGPCTEVILALNTDVESDATAGYIGDLLKSRKVKVTRLAFGLPAGSGIMYSDSVTLARALKGRQAL